MARRLRLKNGWMVLDGGSTQIEAVDVWGRRVLFHLDWSIEAQQQRSTLFSVNGKAIPKGSEEEAEWIAALRSAAAKLPPYDPNLEPAKNQLVLLPPEDLPYWRAKDHDPQMALRALAERTADLIDSERHRKGPPLPPPDSADIIRDLIAQGRRVEAMQAYRTAHPDASLNEARAAVLRIEEEMRDASSG